MKATLPAEIVPCLDGICKQAFLMMAGMDAGPVASDSEPTACIVACRISIHEEEGLKSDLLISADAAFAHHFTQRLFESPGPDVEEEEILDALKELANTVGGNLKGIIESETTLSIPQAMSCSHISQVAEPLASLQYCFADAGRCVVELCDSTERWRAQD